MSVQNMADKGAAKLRTVDEAQARQNWQAGIADGAQQLRNKGFGNNFITKWQNGIQYANQWNLPDPEKWKRKWIAAVSS